jgi:hypothetical protein
MQSMHHPVNKLETTINVLGIEVKKNETASAFKSKGDVLTNSGETSFKGLSAKKQCEYRF